MRTNQFGDPVEEINEFGDPIAEAPRAPEPKQSVTAGAGQSVLQGATFGFADEIQSVIAAAVASPFVSDKTFAQLMIDARNSLRDENKQFKTDNPKTALGLELAGGIAAGAGAAKAIGGPLLSQGAAQIAKVGAVEGAIAGAGFSDSDELLSLDTAISSAIGGAVGGALGVAIPKVIGSASAAIRRRIGQPALQVFDDAGKFTDEALAKLDDMVVKGDITAGEVDDLIKQSAVSDGVLTPGQARRFNLFAKRKVTPLKANVTQSIDDFRNQQSALKRTGPVSEIAARQDAQIADAVTGGIDQIGPTATNIVEANASVFNVIDDVVSKADEAVTAAYQTAKAEARGQPMVAFNNLSKAISDNRGGENVSGGVLSSIRGTLKNKGLLRIGKDIDINKRGTRLAGKDTRLTTVQEAEEIRQSLNSLFDSVTHQGRRIIRKLKDAIDDDVAEAVGDDVFKDARAAKVEFHRLIEKAQRNKFDKTTGSFLEDVIDNKIPQEKIIDRLLVGRDDDLLKFKEFLTKEGGESGLKAWNDIRAQVLRDALDKATSTMGKGAGGQPVFNVRLFKNAFTRLRGSKKFGELFNANEQTLIDDIIEIGNYRIPPSLVQQGKGPTEFAVDELRRKILQNVPVVGERAQGLLDLVANMRTDKNLVDFTRQTEAALTK